MRKEYDEGCHGFQLSCDRLRVKGEGEGGEGKVGTCGTQSTPNRKGERQNKESDECNDSQEKNLM